MWKETQGILDVHVPSNQVVAVEATLHELGAVWKEVHSDVGAVISAQMAENDRIQVSMQLSQRELTKRL